MQNIRHLILCLLLFTTLTACTSGQHQPDDLPLMGLQALQTKSTTGLSGTITVYDLDGKVYLTEDLIFTADTIYAPHLSLPKNTVYRLVLVFYYDENLPIAFLDEDITVGSEASYSFTLSKENIHFSLSEISSDSVLASLSNDVDTGILPDLDLDDDGFSNIVEYRGGSDPRDDTSIPHGPDFDSIDVEYAADGNLVTITVELSDGNYVTEISTGVSNYSYLARGGIFTETLSGDDLDRERTYTLSFNPQYAPVGELTLNFTATNSIDLVSTDSVVLDIVDNGENVGPVIVFDSLSADQVVGGDVEVAMTAYDRDTVTDLDLTSPTSITDTASEAAYFVGNWDTGSQDDGDFTVIATAEDLLGEVTTRRLAISINNGSDGSGPGLQMSIYNANSTSVEINYLNGETVFGVAPFVVVANDASDVSYIQLTNISDLNCSGADLSDCPLTDHSAGLDDFITSNSAYTNSFDTTSYEDGDLVTMAFLTGDSHGSTSTRSFNFTIQNSPNINSISTDKPIVTDGDTVKITWGVEDRTTAVYILDAAGNAIECEEGANTGEDGDCTFTPTQSQAYTVRAAYSTENQYDDVQTFYTDQTTDVVSLDFDDDGIFDEDDNCYKTDNADQVDADEDDHGDICDPDKDGDGYAETGYDFATNYELYVGEEVTVDNQEYATLYTSASYEGEDCDDSNAEVHPDQNERLNANADDNCDGTENEFDFSGSSAFDFESEDSNIFEFQDLDLEEVFNSETGDDFYISQFGRNIKQIGDFNGDGLQDLALSAESYVLGSIDANGVVYVYFGQLNSENQKIHYNQNQPDIAIYGQSDDRLSVVTGGDFDGDGCADLVVGARESSQYLGASTFTYYSVYIRGAASIIWGCQDELNELAPSNLVTIEDFLSGGAYEGMATNLFSANRYSFFGSSFDMKDIDDDGKSELVIGSPGKTSYSAGYTYIIYGPDGNSQRCTQDCDFVIGISTSYSNEAETNITNVYGYTTVSQLSNMRAVMLEGDVIGDYFGNTVKFVGDVDYDAASASNAEELAISAYSAAAGKGVVYLFSMATLDALMPAENKMKILRLSADDYYNYKITGSNANEHFGSNIYNSNNTSSTYSYGTIANSIQHADLDGDDKQDLIIASPSYSSTEGKVYIFFGARLLTEMNSGNYSKALTAPSASVYFGSGLAVCDVDNDGNPEVLVGAPIHNSYNGAVYLFDGDVLSDSTEDAELILNTIDHTLVDFYGDTDSRFGASIACIDLNNDGNANDLAIDTAGNTGNVFLILSEY